MQPTNIQPVTRYFSQQDKIRIGSSRYHIDSVLGSKLGYTNTARYSYVCLAEQDGVRLICATMQSQLSTDKYNDMRTLLDYAFSTYKSYTQLPGGTVTAQLAVAGGGQSLGTVTVADPGVKLLLAEGLSAQDVTVDLELPEQYLLGAEPAVYAVYTLNGGAQQESTSVRVDAEISGLPELLENSTGQELEAAKAVKPQSHAFWLLGISLGVQNLCTNILFFALQFWFGRKYIGLGTFVNGIGVGFIVTAFYDPIAAHFGPAEALGLPVQLLWVALAVPVTALGASLYQTADLGIAPYDYLSLGLRDYTPVPYFGCRVFTDALCAVLAFLLGGLIGLGTLICAFGLGPFVQFFTRHFSEKVLRYKPEKK